ncbi:MAG: hypothetical protein II709_05235, partial [Ruminococcus sp.]|nr:hypothetical protein [Ruminococcus sp.]
CNAERRNKRDDTDDEYLFHLITPFPPAVGHKKLPVGTPLPAFSLKRRIALHIRSAQHATTQKYPFCIVHII